MNSGFVVRILAKNVATLVIVGRLPIAPGTWGSGISVVLWWLAMSRLSPAPYLGVLMIVCLVGVWSAGQTEKLLGRDAKPIVIDEFAGQWIPLMICPKEVSFVVIAFVLFRLFDIWKPFPISSSQKLPGGWGVVVDDVLAGAYALATILILRLLILV